MANEDVPFVPTTNMYNIENLEDIDLQSEEFRDFLVRLRENINIISILLNQKTAGNFPLSEFPTGQIYFPNPNLPDPVTGQAATDRLVYRKAINFGALPNTGTTNVAHGIAFSTNNTFNFTRIYACATNLATSYIPIPYASPVLANNIEISADTTNVIITTGSDRSAYLTTYVVLEYIKS